MKYKLVAIDPGKTGAIACFLHNSIQIYKMPLLHNQLDVEEIFSHLQLTQQLIIEKPFILSKQKSNDIILTNYGIIIGLAKLAKCQIEIVSPHIWKKELGLTKDKNTSLQLAQQLYPNANINYYTPKKQEQTNKLDHDKAEALLLGHYFLNK